MRNPTRRNRNIGTNKQGRSKNNSLVIPERWSDLQVYYEKLANPVKIDFLIKGHRITVLVEPPHKSFYHPCSVEDIFEISKYVPDQDISQLDLIILRQPKRKEEILRPVWGRFVYWADIGNYSGTAIYLESIEINKVIKWSMRVGPAMKRELEMLEADGHKITSNKRYYFIHTSTESCRNTQLYRTLPHEIGHSVDYVRNSLLPSIEAPSQAESDYITTYFRTKPTKDKEDFANRYAGQFLSKIKELGVYPFDKILSDEFLTRNNLPGEWFASL